MRTEPDYYAILGVDSSVSMEELRAQHKKLARELHPDRHAGDPAFAERLTQINAAYNELRNELRRGAYDRRLREAAAAAVPPPSHVAPNKSAKSAGPSPLRSNARREFQTFSMYPQAKGPHKRRALIGAVAAAGLAVMLIVAFFYFGNVQFNDPNLDYGAVSAAEFFAGNWHPRDLSAQRFRAVEVTYQRRLTRVISEALITINASRATADTLDDQGDSDSAATLRRDASTFEAQLVSTGNDVKMLGTKKNLSTEGQMEQALNLQLDALRNSDRLLSVEQQNMRMNALAGGVSPTDGSLQVPNNAPTQVSTTVP